LLGESVDRDSRPGEFHVAVCGAHLRGQPLNIDLVNRGGYLVEGTRTAANYRLYALPDGKRPALIRDPQCDSSIEVEVWSLPDREVAGFLGTIAQPLGIGSVELAGGRWVHSFIAEPIAIEHATEITEFGGWRNYKSSL
jgi:allophanate hydrolase